MNKISQKSLKKYNANRFTAWLLAVLMLFSALSTGSITVQAEATNAVAQIEEATYTSLEAAVDAAKTATEAAPVVIELLADTALAKDVTIENYITLDLKGFTLNLSSYTLSIDSLGKVVDNSESKTGLLMMAEGGKFYSSTQVPVYNTEKSGYVVADIVHQEAKVSEDGADVFKLVFKPDFGETINNLLKSGDEAANVSIEILVSWTGGSQTFVYTDDMVQDVYANSGKAFYINITNFANFANVTVTPLIVSSLGAECRGTTYSLTTSTPVTSLLNLDGEWLGSTGKHNVTVTTTTDPETNVKTVTFAQTEDQHGWGYLSEKLDNDKVYKFKMKLDIASNGSAYIGIRQANTDARPIKAQTAYVLVIDTSTSKFGLRRHLNSSGEVVKTSAFGKINVSEWHEYEFGAVDIDGGVQITLKVDGEEVLSYKDTTNPITEKGYFTIYPGPGNSIAEISGEINSQ